MSQPWTVVSDKPKFKNTYYHRASRNGRFMIQTRRKNQGHATDYHGVERNSQSDELDFLEASLTFVPNAPNTNQIVVTLNQRKLYEGVFLGNPILSFSAVLPDDSKVFQLIEFGDLEGLTKMLILGEARLSDRCSSGRSLLNVSMTEII